MQLIFPPAGGCIILITEMVWSLLQLMLYAMSPFSKNSSHLVNNSTTTQNLLIFKCFIIITCYSNSSTHNSIYKHIHVGLVSDLGLHIYVLYMGSNCCSGLTASLKGRTADFFHLAGSGFRTRDLAVTGPMLLTVTLHATEGTIINISLWFSCIIHTPLLFMIWCKHEFWDSL